MLVVQQTPVEFFNTSVFGAETGSERDEEDLLNKIDEELIVRLIVQQHLFHAVIIRNFHFVRIKRQPLHYNFTFNILFTVPHASSKYC